MRIFLLVICILFITNGVAQNSIKPSELKEDFEYLIGELKSQHQGLYQYLSENQTNRKIDSIQSTLETRQTKVEFYEKLRYLIGLTNEGHTAIELPKWTMIKLGLSKSFLPLSVKFCDENLIIAQNYGKDFEELKRGAKIIAINNKKVDEVLQSLFPLIPTDGFNTTSKKEWIGGLNFSLLYRLVCGKEKNFELQIQNFGNEKVQTIDIPAVRFTKFKTKNAKLPARGFDFNSFTFEQINDSIAYVSIPSFGKDNLDYEKFYQENFKKIDSLNIKHLIIDVQANGGGTEGNENLLFSYLSNKVVKKYKQVTMCPKSYQNNKTKQGYINDQWTLQNNIAKRGEFTLYSDYYSDLGYKNPQNNLIYHGKLYVLISGKTFSGGAEFASLIKMSDRGIFIGEETGVLMREMLVDTRNILHYQIQKLR
ncbi:S41 family peptidase [Tenacibaculum sp. SG-28]|uniref:S41 family peptidase n=1 Tax=Tenacibaculum sp. SG-28 TaxID=754426 RepID=UPI001304B522|nr:S41 family peptidase [Tenacibaculum sp. SG-28]